jgi:hypothetical protein
MRIFRIAGVALSGLLLSCHSDSAAPVTENTTDASIDVPGDVVLPPAKVSKLDLLLMIDNSMSMADKQEMLALAIPDLMQRLVNPACVDPATRVPLPDSQQPTKPLDPCPSGSKREFGPVFDFHIGVITSSLGSHGSDTCKKTSLGFNERMEDMAHLVHRSKDDPATSIETWQNLGFLDWDPVQTHKPPGESDIPKIVDRFTQIVQGTGQDGCGFEALLESWYRFLVDPAPYQSMVPVSCAPQTDPSDNSCRTPTGVDSVVLKQRTDFLRPDSLVAILMLSDEDDCSIRDEVGQFYLAAQAYAGANPFHLPRGTSACATDPESPLCQSCGQSGAASDPTCSLPPFSEQEDPLNLRCFDQKRRFGLDFLYPVSRYVQGLTNATLADGRVNPLFCAAPADGGTTCAGPLRQPSQVFLSAIAGVPWPDIANDPKDVSRGYLSGDKLPWDVILGDPKHGIAPTDPLMLPSVKPRSGSSPITNEPLAPPSSTSASANTINGHEYGNKQRNDLQYACIFKLATPRACAAGQTNCDCGEESDSPLCQADDGTYGMTQYRAKAYPPPRVLATIQGMGARGGLASICAVNTTDPSSADFGYKPAILSFIQAISASF